MKDSISNHRNTDRVRIYKILCWRCGLEETWVTEEPLRMENKSTLKFSFCILKNLSANFFKNIDIAWEKSEATITQVSVERGKK